MPAVLYARLEREVLGLYAPHLRRRSTYFKIRRALREFAELTDPEGKPVIRLTSDITPLAFARWLEVNSHRAPMTNLSYLKAFRVAVNYAKKQRWLRVSPWEIRADWVTFDFDEEDDEDLEARHYSLDELDEFLDRLDLEALSGEWLDLRLQALGYTFAHTGLRTKEGCGLKTTDVLMGRGVIRVRSRRKRKLKTRTSVRLVGIPPALAAVFERWLPQTGCEWLFPGVRKEGPWLYGGPGSRPLDRIKAVAGRAGIPYATIQMFRRSLSTHADRLGINRQELSRRLGHGIQVQEDWYNEQDAANARELAGRIVFRSGPSTTRARPRSTADQPLPCPGVAV